MISPAQSDPQSGPVIEPDAEATYTLDIVASVCGLSSQTILHYHEQGLLHPVVEAESGARCFDDDTVHRLRRIEHLRNAYGMDDAALKLTLSLMDEVERLRAELRACR